MPLQEHQAIPYIVCEFGLVTKEDFPTLHWGADPKAPVGAFAELHLLQPCARQAWHDCQCWHVPTRLKRVQQGRMHGGRIHATFVVRMQADGEHDFTAIWVFTPKKKGKVDFQVYREFDLAETKDSNGKGNDGAFTLTQPSEGYGTPVATSPGVVDTSTED